MVTDGHYFAQELMEAEKYVIYEIWDILSEKHFTTPSREEAIGWYERDWHVFEHHVLISKPSKHVSVRTDVSTVWNGNAEFERSLL